MAGGNAARSAIEPFTRKRTFILNVQPSELLLWNQGARVRRHTRPVPHSQSSFFGRTASPERKPGLLKSAQNEHLRCRVGPRQPDGLSAGPVTIDFKSQG